MVSQAVTFWLSESDQDLIDWLDSLPKGQRSQLIRSALRVWIKGQNRDRLNAKLDRILDQLSRISVSAIVQDSCPEDWKEDREQLSSALLATLGGLGK